MKRIGSSGGNLIQKRGIGQAQPIGPHAINDESYYISYGFADGNHVH
jgi:hypothetical protein